MSDLDWLFVEESILEEKVHSCSVCQREASEQYYSKWYCPTCLEDKKNNKPQPTKQTDEIQILQEMVSKLHQKFALFEIRANDLQSVIKECPKTSFETLIQSDKKRFEKWGYTGSLGHILAIEEWYNKIKKLDLF